MSILSKMMRMSGRGDDGNAKALSTTNDGVLKTQLDGGNAEEPFSGSSDTYHIFKKEMNELVISNDGSNSLTVIVNNFSFEVKAGEVFSETFAPFTVVEILSSVPFRSYAKTKKNSVASIIITDKPFVLDGNFLKGSTNTKIYKGSEFIINQNKTIHSISVKGTVSSWSLWETDSNHNIVGTVFKSGNFGNYVDGNGFKVSKIQSPFILSSGKSYALIASHTNISDTVFCRVNEGTIANNDVMTVTGYSYQLDLVEGGAEFFTTTSPFVYHYKLGVS